MLHRSAETTTYPRDMRIEIEIPDVLLGRIDNVAEDAGETREETLRRLVEKGVADYEADFRKRFEDMLGLRSRLEATALRSSEKCATNGSRRSTPGIRTMTEVLLLDSGVWVAAVNSDDRFEPASRELVADLTRHFGALDLTLYEVANVMGSKRGRPKEAAGVCRRLEERCARTLVRVDAHLIEATAEIAGNYGLTSYDAAYVAVARRHSWQLVSVDLKDLVSKGLAVTPDAAV